MAAEEFGINSESVRDLLAAGISLTCPGTTNRNPVILNAWLMGDGQQAMFVTNAHAFYAPDGLPRLPFEDCEWISFAALERASRGGPPPASSSLGSAAITVAATTPGSAGSPPQDDRARVLLDVIPEGMSPLPTEPQTIPHEGEEVYLVTETPRAIQGDFPGERLLIQRCKIRKAVPIWEGHPGAILTDCDNYPGVSAGLYSVLDVRGTLRPIAIHQSGREKVGEGKPYNERTNSAVGLILDDAFFRFPG